MVGMTRRNFWRLDKEDLLLWSLVQDVRTSPSEMLRSNLVTAHGKIHRSPWKSVGSNQLGFSPEEVQLWGKTKTAWHTIIKTEKSKRTHDSDRLQYTNWKRENKQSTVLQDVGKCTRPARTFQQSKPDIRKYFYSQRVCPIREIEPKGSGCFIHP